MKTTRSEHPAGLKKQLKEGRGRRALSTVLLGVALLVGGFLYVWAYPRDPATECRRRAKPLCLAIETWARETGSASLLPLRESESVLVPKFIAAIPECPAGGKYQIASTNGLVVCSSHPLLPTPHQQPPFLIRLLRNLDIQVGRASAWRSACINQLKQIDGAAESWALEKMRKAGDPISTTPGPIAYLRGGALPACPSGGVYLLATVGEVPRCTHEFQLRHRIDPSR